VPLPAHVRQLADSKLSEFDDWRMPVYRGDQVRLFHTFRGNSVTLIESRPLFHKPDQWSRLKIAQFRQDPETRLWTLYFADRSDRWHLYDDIDPSPVFEALLQEVVQDPSGIFWG
jgi:hypothetical protein